MEFQYKISLFIVVLVNVLGTKAFSELNVITAQLLGDPVGQQGDVVSTHRSLAVECPANGLIQVAGSNGFAALTDAVFRETLGPGPADYNMIYRYCDSCADSHKHLIYKRLTPIPSGMDFLDMFLNNFTRAPQHKLGIDFRLFTSLGKALTNSESWKVCTYDTTPNIGFPNVCRVGFDKVPCQWNSLNTPDSCTWTSPSGSTFSGKSYALYVVCSPDAASLTVATLEAAKEPTDSPTMLPILRPTANPTAGPTARPVQTPTAFPTRIPTMPPTRSPTQVSTAHPTALPTPIPTKAPVNPPTQVPTVPPTAFPTRIPTMPPTTLPTRIPTPLPTKNPTDTPTMSPTKSPTKTPTLPLICDTIIITEDFENQDVSEWTDGRLDQCNYFTNFLGRYAGTGGPFPYRIFHGIPTDASRLTVEFDLYEIDNWWNGGTDQVFIGIGNGIYFVGSFGSLVDEAARNSTYSGDVQVDVRSIAAPAQRCFSSNNANEMDQAHHVTVTFPGTLSAGGSLVVTFYTSMSAGTGSAGFDNIKITAHGSCRPSIAPPLPGVVPTRAPTRLPTLAPTNARIEAPSMSSVTQPSITCDDSLVDIEDFENQDVSDWTGGRLDQCNYFTNFLGRYSGFGGSKPSKTFTGIPTDASRLSIEFDFYEIDNWNGASDGVFIRIDNTLQYIGAFNSLVDESAASIVYAGDIQVDVHSIAAPAQRCFSSNNANQMDQAHHVTVTFPGTYAADGSLTITFFTDMGSGTGSAGFDNIKLIAHGNCRPSIAPPSPGAVPTLVPINGPTKAPATSVIKQPSTCNNFAVTEDFENRDVSGWGSGRLDQCNYFTNFLGRYVGPSDLRPRKTFMGIPTNASRLSIEFDLYEIDNWNGDLDRVWIGFGDIVYVIGAFNSLVDEGATSNVYTGDVQVDVRSTSAPAQRCFSSNSNQMDQAHHVTVTFPGTAAADGSLTITFYTDMRSGSGSVGFDNIRITCVG